jgi:hypothetical protein
MGLFMAVGPMLKLGRSTRPPSPVRVPPGSHGVGTISEIAQDLGRFGRKNRTSRRWRPVDSEDMISGRFRGKAGEVRYGRFEKELS